MMSASKLNLVEVDDSVDGRDQEKNFEEIDIEVGSREKALKGNKVNSFDNREEHVTFTGEERIYDADTNVLASFSRSTDTSFYKSTDSLASSSLHRLHSAAVRVEPPRERPLIAEHHLLVDGSSTSLGSLPASFTHCSHSIPVDVPPSRSLSLSADAAVQDSQLVKDVISDVINQYMCSHPQNTALSFHLLPFDSPATPQLQVHLHPTQEMDASYPIAKETESDTSVNLSANDVQMVDRQMLMSSSMCNCECTEDVEAITTDYQSTVSKTHDKRFAPSESVIIEDSIPASDICSDLTIELMIEVDVLTEADDLPMDVSISFEFLISVLQE